VLESAFQRHCSCGGITGRQAFENGIRKAYKELLKNTEGNAAAPASTQVFLGVHDLFCIPSQWGVCEGLQDVGRDGRGCGDAELAQ
jgi:hypothetical protein